ncbi:MAG: phosphatase PAP2 family protein [Chloroflexota bacterium]
MTLSQLVARRTWLAISCLLAMMALTVLSAFLAMGYVWPGDLALLLEWQSREDSPLRLIMIAVSYIGFALPFLPLIALVGAILWRWRSPAEALFVLLPTAIGYGVSLAIKQLVRRPRPSGEEIDVYVRLDWFGFPSQHVLSYSIFFGLLFYLAWRHWRGEAYRWPTLIVSGFLLLLVGPSRVYLGAHWPTDVLGGYLLGYALWGLTVLTEPRSLGVYFDERAN